MESIIIITFAAFRCILVDLVCPAVALLLTLAGWRPSRAPAPTPAPALPPAPALETQQIQAEPIPIAPKTARFFISAMTVRQLRQVAREEGFTQLARSGRKQQLLEALGGG